MKPPVISEHETYEALRSAKKPRSGVEIDMPKVINSEFAPELAYPVCKLINNIFQTGEWPNHWKVENVIPIPKVVTSETEDDLRPISLTPFLSKVAEQFIVKWILEYIGEKLDFRQYGGQKGNSISHYLVEFVWLTLKKPL